MNYRTRKLMTMHKPLDPREDIDYMCKEKEEEDLHAFKIASMHRYNDSKTTLKKEQRKTNYSDQKQHKDQQNNNN